MDKASYQNHHPIIPVSLSLAGPPAWRIDSGDSGREGSGYFTTVSGSSRKSFRRQDRGVRPLVENCCCCVVFMTFGCFLVTRRNKRRARRGAEQRLQISLSCWTGCFFKIPNKIKGGQGSVGGEKPPTPAGVSLNCVLLMCHSFYVFSIFTIRGKQTYK